MPGRARSCAANGRHRFRACASRRRHCNPRPRRAACRGRSPVRRGTGIRGSPFPSRSAGPCGPRRHRSAAWPSAERGRGRLSARGSRSSMSLSPARSRASNSPIRIGLTSQSVAPAASPAARPASASGDARTTIGPAIPALAEIATQIGGGPIGQRAVDHGTAANRPRPYASQRRAALSQAVPANSPSRSS